MSLVVACPWVVSGPCSAGYTLPKAHRLPRKTLAPEILDNLHILLVLEAHIDMRPTAIHSTRDGPHARRELLSNSFPRLLIAPNGFVCFGSGAMSQWSDENKIDRWTCRCMKTAGSAWSLEWRHDEIRLEAVHECRHEVHERTIDRQSCTFAGCAPHKGFTRRIIALDVA